ncbi:MAG: carboxypeptidase regulatory-like domain-containing protein, partial [Candidatus Sericytochromatia bacterium]|nr:carboxypeptidase regulatory-like domain-containing protein [Candidatus Sericytochromatia bacterium]
MYQRPHLASWLVILAALSSCSPQPTATGPIDTAPATTPVAIMPGSLNADMEPTSFQTKATGYTLAGQMTDAKTGAPIPGGVVTVYGSTVKGTTDAWGYYYLENLPGGSRGAYFVGPGFTGKAATVTISSTAVTRQDVALTFATAGTGVITGQLKNAVSGTAIAGATVYLNNQAGKTTTTDAGGAFRIPNATAGAQQVVVTPTGYKLWPENVKNVILYANGTTAADISLQPDGTATPAPSTAPTATPTVTPTTAPTVTPTTAPTATRTPAGSTTGVYAPGAGVYHGAFAGDLGTTSTATQVNSVVGAFEGLAGKHLGVVNFFVGNGTFPTSAAAAIAARNSLP